MDDNKDDDQDDTEGDSDISPDLSAAESLPQASDKTAHIIDDALKDFKPKYFII